LDSGNRLTQLIIAAAQREVDVRRQHGDGGAAGAGEPTGDRTEERRAQASGAARADNDELRRFARRELVEFARRVSTL
jgi:hypothetical protein